MSSFGYPNGLPRTSFGGYDGGNDYGSVMSYQEEYKPQIYRVRGLYPHPQSMRLTRLKNRLSTLMSLSMKWKLMVLL